MQQHPLSSSIPDHASLVSGAASVSGLQYHPSDYSTAVDPYVPQAASAVHHPSSGDFPSAAMYVNTVWGPDHQAPSHPSQSHVYYESYPGAAAAAMYGYPGHILPGQDQAYPGMQHQPTSESSKRKRRRVISFEQRKAANVRERKRMCHLNDAFDVLRKRVPTFAYEKKLSRIETLKLAVTYIQYMAELLDDIDDNDKDKASPSSSDSSSSAAKGDSHSNRMDEFRSSDGSVSPSSAASCAE